MPLRLFVVGVTAMAFLSPLYAADPASGVSADLQSAYEEAAHDARLSDDLDPAYELLGIAETAHMQSFPQVAAKAATAFADLVKRAATKALKTGGTPAEDALDQFVDLRVVARSANLPLPQAALDEAMASLFPTVSTGLQQKIDDAGSWADKLEYTQDLGDLQASATQILKQDLASEIGAAFDQKTAALQEFAARETDADERTRMEEGLARVRKSREDRVADANINNINVVAALMQSETAKAFGGGARDSEDEASPQEMAVGVGSCIETGFTGQQDPAFVQNMKLDCFNSGRLPAQGRCSTTNLAFLCYDDSPGHEKLTYVYRNTPDEIYFQRTCSPDKLLRADKVPPSGAPFRAANAVLGFTCAPPTTH
jgi:hypothetical protein